MREHNQMYVILARFFALAVFVGAIWLIHIVNWAMGYSLNYALGLAPRRIAGLDGIFGMPILHANFPHLMSNTPPIVLMGALLAATATRALLFVNATQDRDHVLFHSQTSD